MADPKFDPCWLYGPNREAVEIFTQADYDKFAALGWQGSPAAFGIETHPQHPIQAVAVTSIDAAQAAPPVVQLQTQLTQLYGEVVALQAMLESVTNRLEALEALMTSPSSRSTPVAEPKLPEAKPSEDDTTSSTGRGTHRGPDVTTTHDDPGSSAGRRRP